MRLIWFVALTGCLSSDVSLSATEGDTSGDGETTTDTPTTDEPTTTTPTTTTPTTTSDETGGIPQSNCEDVPIRVVTFNVEAVGSAGSSQFEALADILVRLDADVACIEEVNLGESGSLQALAAQVGYESIVEAAPSPAIGGELYNACIGRVPLYLVGSYSGEDLSTGPANDVGRDILAVRAEPVQGCYVGFFSLHLKSGGEELDVFRRTVEVERVAQAVELYRELRPADGLVVLGDFNEQTDDGALGQVFTAPPPGLPESYLVGPDIEFPLVYDPFARLAEIGFTRLDATWEDSNRVETWQEVTTLDYIFIGQALFVASEVYNACQDNGVDDDPPGGLLEKAGEPLACSTSATASDHMPVAADLVLP